MPIVIICKSRLRIQDTYNWGDDEDEVEGGRQEEKGQILKQIAVKAFYAFSHSSFTLQKLFFFTVKHFLPSDFLGVHKQFFSRPWQKMCCVKNFRLMHCRSNFLSSQHYWIALLCFCVKRHESGMKYVGWKWKHRYLQLYRRDSAHDNGAVPFGRSLR